MTARSRFALLVLVVAALIVPAARAQEKTQMGIVVSAEAGRLVMTDNEGKNEQALAVPGSARITVNGKPAALTDLRRGDAIAVTLESERITLISVKRGKRCARWPQSLSTCQR